MSKSFRVVGYLILVVGLLSGCTGGGGGSTQSSDGNTAAVSISPSADASAELYAEAERIYRDFTTKIKELAKTGGADELPAPITSLLTAQMQTFFTDFVRKLKNRNPHAHSGQEVIMSEIKPFFTTSQPNAVLALQMCHDGRHIRVVDANGADAGSGVLTWSAVFFEQVDGVLKISGGVSEEVSSCVFK